MNLLITGAWQDAKEYIETIEKMGHQVRFLQFEKDELPCDYEWVNGIIGNGIFLSHPIEKFVNLRYIQLTSAGFDRVPMDYVRAHNIKINNARGVYSIPMAEFAVSGVLQIYKQARYFYGNQQAHRWEKHRGLMELYGKTVAVIGCGSVGTECAKRFAAFGCNIVGIDLYPREDANYSKMVELSELDQLLPIMDVLVLTLPLTDGTRHLMNKSRFGKMKTGAILVNIARGEVVDTNALSEVLPRLEGAVLDVFEEEPLSVSSPLWKMEKVILTPHNSFVGENNQHRLSDVIIKNLEGK